MAAPSAEAAAPNARVAVENEAPLHVAVFGAGIIASDAHHFALKALVRENVRVVAVWSRTEAKAALLAERYGAQTKWYSGERGVTEVLSRTDVHACVLAVPICELTKFSIRCLDAGKHVLSEKPIAHNVAAARQALNRPRKSNALYAVAENFRFEEGVVAATADAGRLNPVCISLVGAMHMPPESRFAKDWRLAPRHVGAQLLDGGVHFVAALRMAARADVVRVAATTSTGSMHLPAPDSCSAMLEFENGVHATMLISYAAAEFVWEMRVIATDGDLCLKRAKGSPGYRLETRLCGNLVTKEFGFTGIEQEFACFAQSCREGKVDKRIDARAAFNDLATIEAIVKSAESGQAVVVEKLDDAKQP